MTNPSDCHLTYGDIFTLQAQSEETLVSWSRILNTWGWPQELSNPEPRELHGPCSRRTQIAEWIESRVGQRRILRDWNKSMSDEEFNDFWRGNYECNPWAFDRYANRIGFSTESAREKRPTMWQWLKFKVSTILH